MGHIGSMHKDSLICGMATNLQGNWKRLIVTDLRAASHNILDFCARVHAKG
jgi:hypothetical protein